MYLAPPLGLGAVGDGRAARVAELAGAAAPDVQVEASAAALESEDDVRAAIAGADFVVCCLDPSQSNLVFKLNRVCLADDRRWIACAPAGAEVVVGPAIHPGRSACYLCYRMRAVACAADPEDAFAFERYLDRRRRDDGPRRENLVFAAGLAGNLVGLGGGEGADRDRRAVAGRAHPHGPPDRPRGRAAHGAAQARLPRMLPADRGRRGD